MTVESVTVDGDETQFSRIESELTITPTNSLADGQLFTTTIVYGGEPQPIIDPGASYSEVGLADPDRRHFVASEPSGRHGLVSGQQPPRDKATYTFRVSVAPALHGRRQWRVDERTVKMKGRITYVWETADNPGQLLDNNPHWRLRH